MSLRDAQLGETPIVYRVPATTRDVLDYRVFISTQSDSEDMLVDICEWLARHIVKPDAFAGDASILVAWMDAHDDPESPAVGHVIGLCETIANSASLDAGVLSDIKTVLDRENGIDPEWMPKSKCSCPCCRRSDVHENPPGVTCIYDDVDSRALSAVMAAAGVDAGAASEPYYLCQLRGAFRRAEGRQYAHSREEREEKEKFDEFRRQRGANI